MPGSAGQWRTWSDERLQALSERFQVLCITHLPQIAAYGSSHFLISKTVRKDRTMTGVARLAGPEREQEMARMIGGADISATVLASAREMLESRGRESRVAQASGRDSPRRACLAAAGRQSKRSAPRRRAKAKVNQKAKAKVARKYLIETFGCQMNFHDSERMAGLLEQGGYEATTDEGDADVIVINTCSVREKAEEKLFTRLGEIQYAGTQTGERPIVAVAGCVAQQEGDAILQRSKAVDVIIGTQNLKRLPMLVDGAVQRRESGGRAFPALDLDPIEDISFPLGIAKRHDAFKAYVTIIEGCNEFCAFCVVPYTRGKERMRPVTDILADARQAVDTGAREIQLLGQIVNHYQAPDDPACDFADLLGRLNDIDGLERIRFASPHPRHVTAAND